MNDYRIEVKKISDIEYTLYLNGFYIDDFILTKHTIKCNYHIIRMLRAIVGITHSNDFKFLKYILENYLINNVENTTNEEKKGEMNNER